MTKAVDGDWIDTAVQVDHFDELRGRCPDGCPDGFCPHVLRAIEVEAL